MVRTPALAVLATVFFCDLLCAAPGQVTVKKFRLRPIASVAGKDMYREYCTRCHGEKGKGDGPDAPGLRTAPVDLTTIALRNGGRFSSAAIIEKINDFRQVPRTLTDLGDRERALQTGDGIEKVPIMPIWGPAFAKMYPDQNDRTMRLMNLANYLKSIQVKE